MNDTLFKWDDSFLIGIEELDHEHKVLIDDINRLHEELARHGEKSEIEKGLGNICARIQAHFAHEQHVMKEYGYRFYDEHDCSHWCRHPDSALRRRVKSQHSALNAGNDRKSPPAR
jgi:hemerythrin-like metal-binding protein